MTVGDVGYQDADGYLFLCDRKRDMIISGGVNIYPAEIESVLIQMPGVRDCAVFGIPTRSSASRSVPVSSRRPARRSMRPPSKGYLGQHLARYKVPKVVEFSAALPARTRARSSNASCATHIGRRPAARFNSSGPRASRAPR